YEDLPVEKIKLPPRQKVIDYERPPMETQNFVPEKY
ncbi:MAG: polyphosphate kinase 2, partial [Cyanobacteriota bacterium]